MSVSELNLGFPEERIMENIDRAKLLDLMVKFFDFEEIRTLSFLLGIDFDHLRGDGKHSKAREILAYAERRGVLNKLIEAMRQARPDLDIQLSSFVSTSPPFASDADILGIELSSLRQQLDEIRKQTVTDEQLEERIEEMLKTASRAIGRSEELTARMILPPPELTDVQLLPSGALERLEEYRSDENIAYLLTGAFGGAVLGILSNWVTNDPFVITRSSGILIVVFIALTIACIFWARRIHQRADKLKEQSFSQSSSRKATN